MSPALQADYLPTELSRKHNVGINQLQSRSGSLGSRGICGQIEINKKGREEKKKQREKEREKGDFPDGLVIMKSPVNADITCPGATKPQLLRPCALEPVLCSEKGHRNDKPVPCNGEEPQFTATREKSAYSSEDPAQSKSNTI